MICGPILTISKPAVAGPQSEDVAASLSLLDGNMDLNQREGVSLILIALPKAKTVCPHKPLRLLYNTGPVVLATLLDSTFANVLDRKHRALVN